MDTDDPLHELEQLREENETLRRELDGLAFGISHDLRDPLRTIIGYAGLLQRSLSEATDERSQKMLADILGNAEQLNIYVESILQYSRLARRRLAPIDLTDMERICRRGADTASGERPSPALDLLIGELPPARGDSALVEQVFTILIDNAIHFADPHRELKVEVRGRVEDGRSIYEVIDNGIGFSPDHAEDVFVIFRTLEKKDPTRSARGVGLALALRIILRHGGWMKADGRPGRGAVFTFSLPGVAQESPVQAGAAARPSESEAAQPAASDQSGDTAKTGRIHHRLPPTPSQSRASHPGTSPGIRCEKAAREARQIRQVGLKLA